MKVEVAVLGSLAVPNKADGFRGSEATLKRNGCPVSLSEAAQSEVLKSEISQK